jgi:hypothetical protein
LHWVLAHCSPICPACMRAHVGPILAFAPHTGPKKMNICRQFKALSNPLLEQICELRHCTTIDSWPMPSYAAPGSLLDSQCRVDAVLLGYGVHSNLCLLCIDNKIRVGLFVYGVSFFLISGGEDDSACWQSSSSSGIIFFTYL